MKEKFKNINKINSGNIVYLKSNEDSELKITVGHKASISTFDYY
jgi:hypothetical protein